MREIARRGRVHLPFTLEGHDDSLYLDSLQTFIAGGPVTTILWLIAGAAALWLLDRALVWCELRGWIYYRLSPRPRTSALANMLLGVEEIYRPSRRHVIELRMEEAVGQEDDAEGAGAGDKTDRDTIPAPAASASTRSDRPGRIEPGTKRRSKGRRRGRRIR